MVQAIYGAIMGDIVGSCYEFHNIKTKEFSLFNARPHCVSRFTDDTVMTLALADALASAFIGDSFETYTDEDWYRVFTGYMRYARLTAEPTHDHPDGIAGAMATAGAVYLALHNASKDEIKAYVEKYYGNEIQTYVENHALSSFTLDKIRPIYTFDHYAGLCRGTVPFALQAFLESENFEDCIRNTVSIGGDTDTLGAISGAIAEAYYGFDHKYQTTVWRHLTPTLRAVLTKLDDLSRFTEPATEPEEPED